MSRSRLMFLVIVGAAILLAGASIVYDRLDQQTSNNSQPTPEANQGPVRITVAVSPLAGDWLESAVQAYNNQRRRVNNRTVEVRLETQDSLPIWNTAGQWSVISHPTVWIPEADFSIQYANEVGLNFSILEPSLASTVMVWGAPSDRAQIILDKYGALNWDAVQQASTVSSWGELGGQSTWGAFKPGFAQPDRYTSGLIAFLLGAAEFHNQASLDISALNDSGLSTWLRPVIESVPDFATLGMYPAEKLATMGPSVADIALLPENEWLVNYRGLTARVGSLTLDYPDYQFWFNFPYAVWGELENIEQSAAQDFLSFLLSNDQQQRAASFGLRRPDGTPASTNLFDQVAGITTNRPGGEVIQLPSRNELKPFLNRDWTAF